MFEGSIIVGVALIFGAGFGAGYAVRELREWWADRYMDKEWEPY